MRNWLRNYPQTVAWLTSVLLTAVAGVWCLLEPASLVRVLSVGTVHLPHGSWQAIVTGLFAFYLLLFVLQRLFPLTDEPQLWPDHDRTQRAAIQRPLLAVPFPVFLGTYLALTVLLILIDRTAHLTPMHFRILTTVLLLPAMVFALLRARPTQNDSASPTIQPQTHTAPALPPQS